MSRKSLSVCTSPRVLFARAQPLYDVVVTAQLSKIYAPCLPMSLSVRGGQEAAAFITAEHRLQSWCTRTAGAGSAEAESSRRQCKRRAIGARKSSQVSTAYCRCGREAEGFGQMRRQISAKSRRLLF